MSESRELYIISLCLSLLILFPKFSKADNGYRLWLKYDKITDSAYLNDCRELITSFRVAGSSSAIKAAKDELECGLNGLLGQGIVPYNNNKTKARIVLAGTPDNVSLFRKKDLKKELLRLGKDGYIIKMLHSHSGPFLVIMANEDIGVLYGVFHLLRLIQTHTPLTGINVHSSPAVQLRILNHWDNLDGTVERGYAGASLWKWNELPEKIDPRYKDYARANASIGINAVVLNNVNANPRILGTLYLTKVAALAKVFRPYGIRIFLSANFASPESLGHLDNADPLDKKVINWWRKKIDEIYKSIPDFGGFLVKANSEGQPGPQDYHRTHDQGANMLADILAPYGGVLIWRAFVYSMSKGEDRAKMAYTEFKNLDGAFHSNVLLQIKNGPLDFQPREPFSPLFGVMPNTNTIPEFQITQEYLGHNKALVYLAPLWKETLESDTYAAGKGSTIAKVMDGSLQKQKITGMAGVANIGNDSDWCGYLFGQANWFAFGRLAWNHELSSKEIAEEWIKLTLTHDPVAVNTIEDMMLHSREALVNYETPLGLNVLCDVKHYGPAPVIRSYYHRADSTGLGFDRTTTGSDAVSQYLSPVSDLFNNLNTCPEKYLAWFHHVPWDHEMSSGRTFWNELCYRYNKGIRQVKEMKELLDSVKGKVDNDTFSQTELLLDNQIKEANHWKEVCLSYFQKFSGKPLLKDL